MGPVNPLLRSGAKTEDLPTITDMTSGGAIPDSNTQTAEDLADSLATTVKSLKLQNPEVFRGRRDNVQDFLKDFDRGMRHHNVNDEAELLYRLIMTFRGDART